LTYINAPVLGASHVFREMLREFLFCWDVERIVMYKYLFALGSITALLSTMAPNAISRAQTPPSPDIQRSEALTDIQKLIIRSIGAQENTVEVTVSSNVVTVARVNSNMNDTTHSARDNEATAIAAVVTKAMTGRSEFKNIISLRVQYLIRSGVTENGTIIDTIEFREDPKGQFQFHKT
jgi:hypothetical protein